MTIDHQFNISHLRAYIEELLEMLAVHNALGHLDTLQVVKLQEVSPLAHQLLIHRAHLIVLPVQKVIIKVHPLQNSSREIWPKWPLQEKL